ncbi:MAG: Nif11-like leader peptide family RiPP precursor [Lachnospiraceae bacterium]|nr:Nif11-like leader peptide family RiPP precursor [Lachnospiraceae bacterium]
MTENMKNFLTLAKENEEVSEKFKNGLSDEEMTALAKEHGIELTEEDFKTNGKNLLSTDEGTALSDEELDKVAGGTDIFEEGINYRVWYRCQTCGYIERHDYKGEDVMTFISLGSLALCRCDCCDRDWRVIKMEQWG